MLLINEKSKFNSDVILAQVMQVILAARRAFPRLIRPSKGTANQAWPSLAGTNGRAGVVCEST
jgi:hypothetical protein